MALLDIIIEVLKINCSYVKCSGYPNEIEALFYLLFFPSVFIILFVYIVTGAMFKDNDKTNAGIKLLVSVALYAFIVFQGLYSFFASLSQIWWLLLVTLVGLWWFIKHFFGGGGSKGELKGFGSGKLASITGDQGISGYAKKKMKDIITGDEEDLRKEIESAFVDLKSAYNQFREAKKNNQSELAGRTLMDFRKQQEILRGLIPKYARLGKTESGIKVEHGKAKHYWNEYTKWTNKFEEMERD